MNYSRNTIYATVNQCSYNKDFHNHITTNINTLNEKKFKNFCFQRVEYHGQHIICLNLDLQVIYEKTQTFQIPISIFIPEKFPYTPPIFNLILPGNNTVYNSQNTDIDQKSGRIITKSIKNWDFSLSILKIIEEINLSFNKIFPILQAPPGHNINNQIQNPNQNINKNISNCNQEQLKMNKNMINMNSIQNQNYNQKILNNSLGSSGSQGFNPQNQGNFNINYNPYTSNESNQNIKIDIQENYISEKFNSSGGSTISSNSGQIFIDDSFSSDKQIDRISKQYSSHNNLSPIQENLREIRQEIKTILVEKIQHKIQNEIIKNYMREEEQTNYFENAKLHLDYRAQKLGYVLDTSDDVLKKLSNELHNLYSEIEKYREIINSKNCKYITKENCFEFVEKDNKFDSIVQVLCTQATIEDTLIYLKKGFEKGAVSFDDTVKNIRLYSRELCKLKLLKDKLLTKYS